MQQCKQHHISNLPWLSRITPVTERRCSGARLLSCEPCLPCRQAAHDRGCGFAQTQTDVSLHGLDSASKDLNELSKLGHFLKGSSATLGFTKIKDNCQIIQQYGSNLNVDGSAEPDEEVCLRRIEDALAAVKVDKAELEKTMKRFFELEK
jgi:HPt (histidine-containing phosphotransfer) domain-containing protein